MLKRNIVLAIAAVVFGGTTTGCEYTDATYGYLEPPIRWVTFSRPLGNEALRGIYGDGPRMAIDWVDGTSGELAFERDGRVRVTAGGKSIDGVWQIRERTLCTQFGENRRPRCFRQYRDGELYDAVTGSRHGVVRKL